MNNFDFKNSRSLKFIWSIFLVCNTAAIVAQEMMPDTQLPTKRLVIKREAKTMPVQANSTNKQLNPSNGALGPIGAVIDDGWVANMDTVSISATSSISPIGITTTVTPDTTLPLSAWNKVECNIRTKYFTTVTGSQPNDDVIKTTPSIVPMGNSIKFVCPYKSNAHVANIAKSVDVQTNLAIFHTKNGMDYKYSGFLLWSCTRASKTTVNFTCS